MTTAAGKSSLGVIGFGESAPAASRLARILGCAESSADVHLFPDGERRVRVDAAFDTAILYRSLNDPAARDPDDKLVEVLLAASALRDRGASRVILVSPYLSYMRQDTAFQTGEAVSQKVIGRLLGDAFDFVVTVDPHLHRTHDFTEVVPKGVAVSAVPAFAELLRSERIAANTVILGPDSESEIPVRRLAGLLGLVPMAGEKKRGGDRRVEIVLPDPALVKARPVILFDDMVSTGATLCQCAKAARAAGAASVEALTVHALFGEADKAALREAGIARIRSSDSLPHPTNALYLAPLIAEALAPKISG